jgi:hypothetical protein
VDRFKIIENIGSGAQHIVGRLQNGLIIKYPHVLGRLWDLSTAATVEKDLARHKRWGTPIPETSVVYNPEIETDKETITPPYAILTREIRGRVLRELDLADPGIREQMTDLVKRSLVIREKTGAGVDFMGFEAFRHFARFLLKEKRKGQLGAYNLRIDTRDQIKLIDTNLLDPVRAPLGMQKVISLDLDLQHGAMVELLQDKELVAECARVCGSKLFTGFARRIYAFAHQIEERRANPGLFGNPQPYKAS